jgi:hypothetical protein
MTSVAQLNAQDAPARPVRSGFWIGAGIGAGSLGLNCSGCSADRVHGPAAYVRIGGTLTTSLQLGLELDGWAITDRGVEQVAGGGFLVLVWYPSQGPWYLKVGPGGFGYASRNGATETEDVGTGLSLGAGYEFRVARALSLAPFFNAILSTADMTRTVNGTEVTAPDNIQRNLLQFGLALTLH